MKTAVIHQPQYFPYLGFFHKLNQGDIFVAMDTVQFERRGLQHRNKIKTSQGSQWITVPVCHRAREEEFINTMEINSEFPWSRKHWNAIVTNYARAPYFAQYSSGLEKIFQQEWVNLCELNMAMMRWVMEILEINKPIVYMSALGVEGNKSELLINICQAIGANAYLSGIGGRQYMDMAEFTTAGIDVFWQEFSYPTYTQMFPELDFAPNLSILDTLFCCGSDTKKFLNVC
ncbi:WbqC family protein [Anabaena sp. UHCC 0399]|uniref:WbqC family protein n=1 Tax=Anabaena sp. UHCC 0399 TaxID=3110238 RepID=UPI002B208606|nr:WbqC family protein [Anabaena sp. UHCC 0399]MEA5567718.1 WbqC family protein [Anabaena sp. UHCC 0399]